MQFERFQSLNHGTVAWFDDFANSPKYGETSVVVIM